jgi:dCMP deaminase
MVELYQPGWNGVPAGHQHCCDVFAGKDMTDPVVREEHRIFSELYELHAEQNCLSYAARHGIETDGADLWVEVSPCNMCSKLIIAHGIKNVFYKTLYDRETNGLKLLENQGIKVQKI